MAFATLHTTKLKGNMGGLGNHIDREQIPENVDPNLTDQNLEFCADVSKSLHHSVQDRIEKSYTGKKAIRKDAVKAIAVLLTGSHDRMKEIQSSKMHLLKWGQDNYNYLAEKFGEENIVRCTMHLDEKTPHIHAVVVPMVEGKLNASYYLDGKKKLRNIQTEYAEKMNHWGLERGVSNENRKHTTTKDFYKYITKNELDAKQILDSPKALEYVGKMLQMIQGEKQQENIQEQKTNKTSSIDYNERRDKKITSRRETTGTKSEDRAEDKRDRRTSRGI